MTGRQTGLAGFTPLAAGLEDLVEIISQEALKTTAPAGRQEVQTLALSILICFLDLALETFHLFLISQAPPGDPVPVILFVSPQPAFCGPW